jgi:putative acyl-CoA dehydrogenase
MDWSTHSVSNQVDELRDVDLLAIDPALQQHLRRLGAAWALPGLHAYGTALGRSTTFEQAAQANAAGPVLQRFDARGRRIDEVRFHPDWHALLTLLRGQGWMARPLPTAARAAGPPPRPACCCTARWRPAPCARPP